MKRITTAIIMFLSIVSTLFASAARETSVMRLGVMQGPTGFSSVMLPDEVQVSVFPSPNEAMARMLNGELDMAVLPANTAANLYMKGSAIRFVAIVGEGMLSIVGSNPDYGVLSVPGAGGTPDQMASLLYPQAERSYSVTAPAQLAQLLIAGKCEAAILPQPFVNMVLARNKSLSIISDVQSVWTEKTGLGDYPMSVLVVREGFDPSRIGKLYRKSIEDVLSNPSEAARLIGEAGIMDEAMALLSIGDCALVYKDGKEARVELEGYLAAIGMELPSDNFYLL